MNTELWSRIVESTAEHFDHRTAQVTALPSTQGEVWRIDLDGIPTYVIKRSEPAAMKRERSGLRVCEHASLHAPRIFIDLQDVIVSTWMRGHEGTLDLHTLRAAGTWLARLHAIPCEDDDPLSPTDAVALRAERWASRARGLLPQPWLDEIVRTCRDQPLNSRVWCHRDFVPEHWRIDPDHGLGVIDFGQARLDVAPWDLVKLAAHWNDSQRDAFFEGYGSSSIAAPMLNALVLLHGLQTAVWGDRHQSETFSKLGRNILESRLASRNRNP